MKFTKSIFGKDSNDIDKFNELDLDERSIVFYAENTASFVTFDQIIYELTEKMGHQICYLTSAKDDPILKNKNKNIRAFYIGDSEITKLKFFLELKARILVMTMPDLETFHIKRSKVYPVHYVHILHSVHSTHYAYRNTAFDNFDTIFCTGNYQIDEIQEREKKFNLKKKELVKIGHGTLDSLINEVQNTNIKRNTSNNKLILIAASWGPNGLLETKCQEVIRVLLDSEFDIILRLHPMALKKSNKSIQKIEKSFKDHSNFKLETNIRDKKSLFLCDCMISDWSGLAIEYAFAFEKPVLFIDTPQKINNPDCEQIELVAFEKEIRSQIGEILSLSQLSLLPSKINQLLLSQNKFKEEIKKIREETVFNVGNAGEQGAKYLLELKESLES